LQEIFKKILVLFDGSEQSKKALEYALNLKKSYKSKIIVLQIIPSDIRYELNENQKIKHPLQFENTLSLEQIETYQNLKKIMMDLKTKFDIKIIVAIKSITAEIFEFAENNNVDLIVMGSRGRSGFKKLLLGSVASSVVVYSHCPVFVIK